MSVAAHGFFYCFVSVRLKGNYCFFHFYWSLAAATFRSLCRFCRLDQCSVPPFSFLKVFLLLWRLSSTLQHFRKSYGSHQAGAYTRWTLFSTLGLIFSVNWWRQLLLLFCLMFSLNVICILHLKYVLQPVIRKEQRRFLLILNLMKSRLQDFLRQTRSMDYGVSELDRKNFQLL